MHALQLLHTIVQKSCPKMHRTRLAALITSVNSLLLGRRLTLTALGRSTEGPIQVKNKIKFIDRLLGNRHLHREIMDCYKALASTLIGHQLHPIILVDWSTVDNRNQFHVLKASLAYEGRAITIYDQVEYRHRPRKALNNSHDRFVENLSQILPAHCQPIIVTDAGFMAQWFKRIEAKGWYWVGRVRGLVKIQALHSKTWQSPEHFFRKAAGVPVCLGEYIMAKKNPLECVLYLHKDPKKGRARKNKNGSLKKADVNHDYARSYKEPWLLASNLPRTFNVAKKVVALYKKRMQIEETFRDLKDYHYGMGVRATLSNTKERIAVLLLIAALGLFTLGLIGKAGYDHGLHRQFQANTVRDRRVLSFWYLGQQMYAHLKTILPLFNPKKALAAFLQGIPTYEML